MDALKIKYEDSEIILVVKPAGIATESRRIGEKDMVSMVKNYRVGKRESSYIGMVHRLDQLVGGLLLFAKTKEAASKLSSQLQSGTMEKYYQALLCGRIEEEGRLTDYLIKDGKTNVSRVAEKGMPGAKEASLRFWRRKVFPEGIDGRILESGESANGGLEGRGLEGSLVQKAGFLKKAGEVSLVEIKLNTGRHHQIRVQMAHHGFPLLGDRKYNAQEASQSGKAGRKQGLALFAWRLRFRHPKTGEEMEFREEPEHFTVFANYLNL